MYEGLSNAEAEEYLRNHGENRLIPGKKQGFFIKFILSFTDTMTVILLISAVVSFVVSRINGEFSPDGLIILAIVTVNGFISTFQECKAEKTLEALKELSSPICRVIRDGREISVKSEKIAVNDVVLFEKGNSVPADCIVAESHGLVADEAPLTGESAEIAKEKGDTVFSGTSITAGHGVAIVEKTGMKTEIGKIASLIGSNGKSKTPLQKRLAAMSATLGNASLIICLAIFILSLIKGFSPTETFINSVSLAVAAIPEGLTAIVTVMLSMGVSDMAGKKAIVKKLPAVETLGCTTVICSDKTGTLTENKLKVIRRSGDIKLISKLFLLNNRQSSPTENALYDFASENYSGERLPIISEVPFDSKTRIMATCHKENGKYLCIIKGSPEEVAKHTLYFPDTAPLNQMTSEGLRVIGCAYCVCDTLPENPLNIKYIYAGLAGMADTPRKLVKSSIEECKKAGIKVVMITGDHKVTALSIAKQLGIASNSFDAATEEEIMRLPQNERKKAILEKRVFARSSPGFKVKIVEAFAENGEVTAMTGDGVNDSPSLKRADIGVAMGKGGTDVAREASDIILTDDNFSTIVDAVKVGRRIYANIRKAVHFLVSCNIGEIFSVFCFLLMSLPSPLSAVKLLWVNLVTDSLPAIALGYEKCDKSIMEKPPVKKDESIIKKAEWLLIILEGVSIGVLTVLAYMLGTERTASTMAFGVLSFSQLFHSFNMRSEKPILLKSPNIPLLLSFTISAFLQLSAMIIPSLMSFFGTSRLNTSEWIYVILLSSAIFVFEESGKLLSFFINKSKSCCKIK